MKLSRRGFLEQAAGGGTLVAARAAAPWTPAAETGARFNILYVIQEDIGPQIACYGEPLVRTPHLDRFATQAIRFTNALCSGPVCSASRSALMTGCYQTRIGAHQHRTWQWNKLPLPPPVRHISEWFRDAGYFTCNLQPASAPRTGNPRDTVHGAAGLGKVDLNFLLNAPQRQNFFDGTDWNQRHPGQPFFAHITIIETHKGEGWKIAREQPKSELVDSGKVKLASYYPDSPIARDEYANYLDAIHLSDGYVGQLLARCEPGNTSTSATICRPFHTCSPIPTRRAPIPPGTWLRRGIDKAS